MKTIIIDVSNHRHAGNLVAPGTTLTVEDATAAWMIARGKAHVAPESVKPSPEPIKKV
jgi:hypothetical protein